MVHGIVRGFLSTAGVLRFVFAAERTGRELWNLRWNEQSICEVQVQS